MHWLLTGAFWPHFPDLSQLPGSVPLHATNLSDTDLRLVRIVYDFIAAETLCDKCAALLGRSLSLAVTGGGPGRPGWQILVVTRCRGWRRHRHTAVVTDLLGHLRLEPLRA
ncbi:hypothetical protein [Paractinoplanes maris]|uniref:hypothetical protein n=1 Tax=Paractinoplanes maris TaxID=1734446 RepID=UPI0020228A15|nr:hypothetical protein [Actinoplanes maris]